VPNGALGVIEQNEVGVISAQTAFIKHESSVLKPISKRTPNSEYMGLYSKSIKIMY